MAAPEAVEELSGQIRPLGQIRESFIIATDDEGLLLFDQHAAHERILFERFRDARRAGEPVRQQLLIPETIDLAPAQVAAFDRLCTAMPYLPMRLSIAGDGELLAGIRRQVRESGLNEKVSLLGWRTDVNKLMLGFDMFVLSSLSEGGSYTVLDAMAAGLPVVSTKVFGTKETIAQVPGNVLVPAGDPDTLARGMQRMANLVLGRSPRRALEQIGQANRDYVRSHFTQSDSTRRTLEVYRHLRSTEMKEHSYLALARSWETSTKHHRSTP